jgi:hypothetical protein
MAETKKDWIATLDIDNTPKNSMNSSIGADRSSATPSLTPGSA